MKKKDFVKQEVMVKKVLTIAGSDSSAGAGIQADIKTFAALGVYGNSVITAITAQNTLGVDDVFAITPESVGKQIDAVIKDVGADSVKTGMLYTKEIIEVVADRLNFYSIPYLVIDPVMVSSSGSRLLNPDAEQILGEKLLPLAALVTPNVDEASVLCGFSIKNEKDIYRAARDIYKMGPDSVVITGFSYDEHCQDFFYDGNELIKIPGRFIKTPSTHGTGCSFSAAITAYLARGYPALKAVIGAKNYVTNGLDYAYQIGAGRGPINHLAAFFPGNLENPAILENRAEIYRDWGNKIDFSTLPLLNVIIGGPLCKGKNYAQLTRMVIEGGAQLIQLREKEGETSELVQIAREMQGVCRSCGAFFVVNDRVDVAAAAGADGVHLGQDDLSPRMARALLGPGKIIGVSVDNLEQAQKAAAEGADYLGLGPAYSTLTKDCRLEAGGASLINEVAPGVNVPVLAIGGITPENTLPLLKAGASGVAVISSVLASPRPEQEVKKFIDIFKLFDTGRTQ